MNDVDVSYCEALINFLLLAVVLDKLGASTYKQNCSAVPLRKSPGYGTALNRVFSSVTQ